VSTFSGLSTALSSLYAQRRGMDVTGQNVANANTDGYTRQRVDLQSVGPAATPAIYATPNTTGDGVQVGGVARLQDVFLENRGRVEHAQGAYLNEQKQVYASVEQALSEPGDNGLQSQLSAFWSAWHDLANTPGDAAARTQLIERGGTVANSLHSTSGTLAELWSATREQLDVAAADVNGTAAQVAKLNQAIVRAGQADLPTNELADQRDQLVMHLAELTGATVVPHSDGAVDVLLTGAPLVTGGTARTVEAVGARRLADQAGGPAALRWTDTTTPVTVVSGQVASTLETLSTTLPRYTAALDTVAATLASTVNAQHAAGFERSGTPGGAFFTGTTAATITVALTDPDQVAAAGTPGGTLDGGNADLLAGLAVAAGGPDPVYRQLVVDVGVATQTVNRRADIQSTVTTAVDAARQGESGVNLDEEMTNMLTYQRAYEAASRVINAIDESLDTLINHTGLVGR
jgi:flagellar hook-associated protein 1 FlgK